MSVRVFHCQIQISPLFMGLVTVLLILDTTGMAGTMLGAMLVHELGHLLFMGVYGCLPTRIVLQPFEINMVNTRPPEGRMPRLLISLGGIWANWLLWLPGGSFGQANLVLALFQSLPLYSMDGYQMVARLLGEQAAKWVGMICTTLAVGLGGWLAVTQKNPMLLLFGLYLTLLCLKENH